MAWRCCAISPQSQDTHGGSHPCKSTYDDGPTDLARLPHYDPTQTSIRIRHFSLVMLDLKAGVSVRRTSCEYYTCSTLSTASNKTSNAPKCLWPHLTCRPLKSGASDSSGSPCCHNPYRSELRGQCAAPTTHWCKTAGNPIGHLETLYWSVS